MKTTNAQKIHNYMKKMLLSVSEPLTDEDERLMALAISKIERVYVHGFHQLVTYAIDEHGNIYESLQLDCNIGPHSVCAEVMAAHRAYNKGETLKTIVTAHQQRPDKGGKIHIVVPCINCCTILLQQFPEVNVIINIYDQFLKVPVSALVPIPDNVLLKNKSKKIVLNNPAKAVMIRDHIKDMLFAVGKPLTNKDQQLLSMAESKINLEYPNPSRRSITYGISANKITYEGLRFNYAHNSTCPEINVMHDAAFDRVELATIITMYRKKTKNYIITPCAGCRTLLLQFYPEVNVIVYTNNQYLKIPINSLVPIPYKKRIRLGNNNGTSTDVHPT